ncbi:MAG: hypothetical protein U0V02_17930 [Anaerolineales bacterium]
MKNKKHILISLFALLAILVSACASTASAAPAQVVESQTVPTAAPVSGTNANAPQPASGGPSQQGGPDLTAAAATLGISVDTLQQALQNAIPVDCATSTDISAQGGQNGQNNNCRPDLSIAATTLGITAEELQAALGFKGQGARQGGPDFAAAATTLGITEDALKQALQDAKPADCSTTSNGSNQDMNCHPDLSTAATTLGITVDELQSALGVPPLGQQPSQGGPGNGQQPPAGGQQAP